MLTFIRHPHRGTESPRLASTAADDDRQLRVRWRNFSLCPHCRVNGQHSLLVRLNEWGPMISRSDGCDFHLVMGDRPIAYPAERGSGKTEMMSAGFWYVHEANGGSTETVVVILRKPPRDGTSLLRHLETVADRLHEELCKSGLLACLYEFDGRQLHEVVY
jgi:hypothetical protein